MIFFFVFSSGMAQEKQPKKEKKRSQAEVDNSFAPFKPQVDFESGTAENTKKARKSGKHNKKNAYRRYVKNLEKKRKEFYKRMKKNAKEDRKMARMMKKPQYSDPMYFGHKRKPKKRPVGKRKFCNECGIVH